MMEYKDYAKEVGSGLPTGINTRLNSDYRISSVYRRFANPFFESWGWETFLWNGDRIENQYEILQSADQVINLHTKIYREFSNS